MKLKMSLGEIKLKKKFVFVVLFISVRIEKLYLTNQKIVGNDKKEQYNLSALRRVIAHIADIIGLYRISTVRF